MLYTKRAVVSLQLLPVAIKDIQILVVECSSQYCRMQCCNVGCSSAYCNYIMKDIQISC